VPEGPEIKRAADTISAAISGRKVEQIFFAFSHLKRYEVPLTGTWVTSVRSFGKAMLTTFSNGLSIYSHNQLYGRWYCCLRGSLPTIQRQLRLAIHNRENSALLYSASDITVLNQEEAATHPFLGKLGPDTLAPETTRETITCRLQDPRFRNRQLGRLLTDQSFVAGLGNYLRCEILFATGLSPRCRPGELDNRMTERLAEMILALPRQSYATGGITNQISRARRMMQEGASFEEARFLVFRREGKPCYRCGNAVRRELSGGQPTYLCPRCQQECRTEAR